jgi:hypothetical protein
MYERFLRYWVFLLTEIAVKIYSKTQALSHQLIAGDSFVRTEKVKIVG